MSREGPACLRCWADVSQASATWYQRGLLCTERHQRALRAPNTARLCKRPSGKCKQPPKPRGKTESTKLFLLRAGEEGNKRLPLSTSESSATALLQLLHTEPPPSSMSQRN